MESLAALLAMITGLIVRLALPMALTLAAVYLLRKLDAHWQIQAEEESKKRAEGKTGEPCWEVMKCPAERRGNCPAFHSNKTCWQVHRQSNGYLLEDCLTCEVFLKAPVPWMHAQV